MKSRLVKYVLSGLALLALAVFWAFTHFFFNPFEGTFEYKLSTLVPRDVDFFVTEPNLIDDFDPLPRLAFADKFEASPHGRAILEFDAVRELLDSIDVDGLMAELDQSLAQAPIDIDPLEAFGGREIALGGYFRGSDLAQADWAVYGRASWLGKLGAEVIRSGLLDLRGQGITMSEIPDGFTLAGGQLPRPIHFTRILDVIVVSTSTELIRQAHVFEQGRGEDSFGLSAQYADHVARLRSDSASASTESVAKTTALVGDSSIDDQFNFYIDQQALIENLGLTGAWPDPRSEVMVEAFAGKLFQLGMVRDVMTTASFQNGLRFDATGKLSAELMTPLQKRAYRERGFDRREIFEFAAMAPADVGIFVFGRAPLNDLLGELAKSIDPATLELLESPIRDVWGYSDIYPVLGDISASFGDRVAFFMRDHDYPPDTGADAPPHDDAKVAAWAAVFEVDDSDTLSRFTKEISANQAAFGIQGRNPGKGGVFTNEVESATVTEYHHFAVPGTGHISTIEIFGNAGRKYFIVTNSHELAGQAWVTYRLKKGTLANDNWFQSLVNAGMPNADFVAYLNPRAMRKTTRAIAQYDAELDSTLAINWDIERPRIEKMVLKRDFPGEKFGAVSPENADAFESVVQLEIDAFETAMKPRFVGELVKRYARPYDAAEIARAALFELSIDPKAFRLHGRIVTPFDEAAR